ncbi:hypothetical protein PHYBLDRAFT_145640 [Phycomyces blakesleeanus NRRL 1555(-)]|uniref:Uncharacterized protein n=1 Tax=Phycomyces blakesleeanus (strain ATCC 8743b / DSM 1359 / FGSC 10004 / NBRC 33097 / NRRL 1555) TaxID=763407 RepID=A0A162ND63_PHYB8|nr:hypothetical protein PHYBLDRAFT_145640 [Phycomyces blakesleeanus NRRL 1555(-)]OAD73238.1 hypothetical protein PHYBLDRAFT_145640 [Phycomyces blakesleeanus NRRL 1555(-)]|eukprot:XP_018291278.1 hypothetical protein PHYBLDRAFT_145640 [Phycomyces blakesleeanus NRRL 1555(-)]
MVGWLCGANVQLGHFYSYVTTIKVGTVTLESNSNNVVLSTKNEYLVSDFSSIGATNELALKLNLAGIGGGIFSALPRFLGGAGLVRLYDAITGKVQVSPIQISFNDTPSFAKYKTQTLTIHNTGKIRTTFKAINVPSVAISSYRCLKYGYRTIGPVDFVNTKTKKAIGNVVTDLT